MVIAYDLEARTEQPIGRGVAPVFSPDETEAFYLRKEEGDWMVFASSYEDGEEREVVNLGQAFEGLYYNFDVSPIGEVVWGIEIDRGGGIWLVDLE